MQITDTKIVSIPLSQLVCNEGQIDGVPANPRILRDEKYRALVASLRADNLTGINPLKVIMHQTETHKYQYIVLGGNMRLRALQEIGATVCPCIEIPQDTPVEVLRKIVVLDNSTFGEWDWDMLANEWDDAELKEWGLDVPASVSADEFGTEFNLPSGEKQPFQQMTFSLADTQAEVLKQAIEDAKHLEEYKHQDTFGNANSNGNAIALIVQQWVDARK